MSNAQGFAVVRKIRANVAVVLSKHSTLDEAGEAFDALAPESLFPDGGQYRVVYRAENWEVGQEIPAQ